MRDTTDAPGSPSTISAGKPNLGLSPLSIAAIRFAGFGLGGILVGFICLQAGGALMVLFVIGILAWPVAMIYFGARLMVLLVSDGNRRFQQTEAAIAEGRIGFSYRLKGETDVAVVDETRRLLCINGDIIGFDQVKRLSMQSDQRRSQLLFSLTSGANPIRSVDLRTDSELETAFARVSNSLGFQ